METNDLMIVIRILISNKIDIKDFFVILFHHVVDKIKEHLADPIFYNE